LLVDYVTTLKWSWWSTFY